jgi:hypothetical protein
MPPAKIMICHRLTHECQRALDQNAANLWFQYQARDVPSSWDVNAANQASSIECGRLCFRRSATAMLMCPISLAFCP